MRTCKHDRDIQCLHDCPECSEYIVAECCRCGKQSENLLVHKDNDYCAECLAQEFISEADETIYNFMVGDYFDAFVQFVAKTC